MEESLDPNATIVTVPRRCECRICIYGREVDALCVTLTPSQSAFIYDMHERLLNAECSLEIAEAELAKQSTIKAEETR